MNPYNVCVYPELYYWANLSGLDVLNTNKKTARKLAQEAIKRLEDGTAAVTPIPEPFKVYADWKMGNYLFTPADPAYPYTIAENWAFIKSTWAIVEFFGTIDRPEIKLKWQMEDFDNRLKGRDNE